MVLRKRAPPHLYNLSQGNARSESRSPISKTSPTSISVSSSSPKCLTRPRRAQSSPHPHRVPSQESVFSPDLNTSPAFALMSLEQAQRSPIRTSSTDIPNPWADELIEKPTQSHTELGDSTYQPPAENGIREGDVVDTKKGDRVPPIVLAGTQRRMAANEWQSSQGVNDASDWEYLSHPPIQLQSNNPFLKATHHDKNLWDDRNSHASYGSSLSRDDASGGLRQDEGYIPMTARLSLFDQQESQSPWVNEPGSTTTQHQISPPQLLESRYEGGSGPSNSPAALDGAEYTHSQLQPPQVPPKTGTSTPGTLSTATTVSSHVLIDFDESPRPDLGSDLAKTMPPSAHSVEYNNGGQTATLESDQSEKVPLSSQHNVAGPAVPSTSEHPRAPRYPRQRHNNIKKNAQRHTQSDISIGKIPRVLSGTSQSSPPPIVRALQTREQISLGLLIEALFDELTTRLGPDEEFPDIEALSRFLTMLHTGMNVNPRLTLETKNAPGTFLETGDIKFYGTFGVPLVHGWIASPSSQATAALTRVGQYHEDIQLLPFRKQELEDRVFQGASLTPEEETVMADIHAIQHFTDVDNATQLSPFGLDHLTKTLQPGSLSILFRNDHFSTLYKHPQLHQLFTLVTDAGYSNHAEVVWESLVDVNGSNTSFCAGDFRVVSQHAPRDSDPPGPQTSRSNAGSSQKPTLSPQEQADADYAYALSLQYQEEEQRGNNRTAQRASAPHLSPPGVSRGSTAHSRSSSAVNVRNGSYTSPAGIRTSAQRQSYGRHSQPHFETNRPAQDESDDAPPPSYEQAAQSPAYPSPQRSPNVSDTPTRAPYQRNYYGRRPPGAPPSPGLPERGRDRAKDRDCIVM
ncbi:hypothetical protein ARAM_004429 [Aspergillus rambellii]|uniref:MINDY deubiquitinase domain-containing protein n=1 Tax=Aspergillus rambellii TaxID=308745 RepID=A0A0F8WY40_9EURO|nr:hypothetical protein ARAM_004429 [Aspergillus rambellii]